MVQVYSLSLPLILIYLETMTNHIIQIYNITQIAWVNTYINTYHITYNIL